MWLKKHFPTPSGCNPVNLLHQPPASQQVYKSTIPSKYNGFSVEHYFATRFTYQTQEDWTAQILNGDIFPQTLFYYVYDGIYRIG